MPIWAIIGSSIGAIILIVIIICLLIPYRQAKKPAEMTREQFALRCVPAILGHPQVEGAAAPISEKLLVCLVIGGGIFA